MDRDLQNTGCTATATNCSVWSPVLTAGWWPSLLPPASLLHQDRDVLLVPQSYSHTLFFYG